MSATVAGVDSGVSNPSDPSCLELPRKFDLPAISESNWWKFNNSLTNLNWSEATTSYSTRFFRRNALLIILKRAETLSVLLWRRTKPRWVDLSTISIDQIADAYFCNVLNHSSWTLFIYKTSRLIQCTKFCLDRATVRKFGEEDIASPPYLVRAKVFCITRDQALCYISSAIRVDNRPFMDTWSGFHLYSALKIYLAPSSTANCAVMTDP